MPKLHILVGVAGSGKSTFAQTLKDDCVILSSDDIRMQIFGDLKHQERRHHVQVFNTLKNRLRDSLANNSNVVIDATNLSRKHRRLYYDMAKSRNYEVIINLFIKPFSGLLDVNDSRSEEKALSESTLKAQYTKLQIPKIGLDCDKYVFRELDMNGMRREIVSTYDGSMNINHDSPYHMETIGTHINTCILNCNTVTQDSDTIKDIDKKQNLTLMSFLHDLGKVMTRGYNDNETPEVEWYNNVYKGGVNKWKTYHSHAHIGALYALLYIEDLTVGKEITENNLVAEAIYHHMNFNMAEKYINKNIIDDDELDLIKSFQVIDKMSSQPDMYAIAEIDKIKNERGKNG